MKGFIMARICKKEGCNNHVPKSHVDENGKKHNCQKRKFCLDCSPFGQHNTRNLNNKNTGICCKCGEQSQNGRQKCFKCFFEERSVKISKKVYNIVGYDCWKCGYDKGYEGKAILDFHHLNPKNKLFSLTTRELTGHAWKRVFNEMQKCVSLCCRCHREYHAGLVSDEEIDIIYKQKWKIIKGSLTQW